MGGGGVISVQEGPKCDSAKKTLIKSPELIYAIESIRQVKVAAHNMLNFTHYIHKTRMTTSIKRKIWNQKVEKTNMNTCRMARINKQNINLKV